MRFTPRFITSNPLSVTVVRELSQVSCTGFPASLISSRLPVDFPDAVKSPCLSLWPLAPFKKDLFHPPDAHLSAGSNLHAAAGILPGARVVTSNTSLCGCWSQSRQR